MIFNTTINQLETYTGSKWNPLALGNTINYAQFRANAAQGSFSADVTKVNFPSTVINIGSINIA